MNKKIAKLKAEREKTSNKIEALQKRNRELDEMILKMENSDIIGIVREQGMTPDELAELLASLKTSPLPEKTVLEEGYHDNN